jgi:hypothetical protein
MKIIYLSLKKKRITMDAIISMYDSDETIDNSTETTPIKNNFFQINSSNNDDNVNYVDEANDIGGVVSAGIFECE